MLHTAESPLLVADAYLIVLDQIIVAQDVAEIIGESDPTAHILIAGTQAAALVLLETVTAISVAFVAAAPSLFAGTALQDAVRARGGRIVLMGEAAEREGAPVGCVILPQPFLPAAVTRLLARDSM